MRTPQDLADRRSAAIVGSSGFIGTHLASALRRAGARVSTFPRGRPVADDPDLICADTVVFVAGSVTPATAERRPDLAAADRNAFRGLLRSLRRVDGPTRVILASSGGTVYSPDATCPCGENALVAPTTVYGAAKAAMEADLLDCPWVEPVVLRVANVYGPGQRPSNGQGVVAHWLDAVASGLPMIVYGDPASTRDYVHVDDVVQAILLAHESRERRPAVLNIGSGMATTLADLAYQIDRAVGGASMVFARRESRGIDRLHSALKIERARVALGWRPQVSLVDGLRRTWAHVSRAHRLRLVSRIPPRIRSRVDRD